MVAFICWNHMRRDPCRTSVTWVTDCSLSASRQIKCSGSPIITNNRLQSMETRMFKFNLLMPEHTSHIKDIFTIRNSMSRRRPINGICSQMDAGQKQFSKCFNAFKPAASILILLSHVQEYISQLTNLSQVTSQ